MARKHGRMGAYRRTIIPATPSRAETRLFETHGGAFARKYAKMRAEGRSVKDALSGARYAAKFSTFPKLLPFDRAVELPQSDGFVAHVKLVDDQDADLSWFGEWSDTWKPGAIAHNTEHVHNGDRRSYRYFIPGYDYTDWKQYIPWVGRRDAYNTAREYARRDYRRMLDYGNGWSMVGVVVTITHKDAPDVKLGRASLWGIESDSDSDYFEETARELIPEAMEEARAKAQRLADVFRDASTHRETPPSAEVAP